MTVISMPEPIKRRSVGNKRGPTVEARLSALEAALPEVHAVALAAHTAATSAATAAQTAADNTSELLALANAAKGVGGFLVKHGPRIVAFGTGILATLGIGNPKLIAFVQNFFS